MRGDGIAYADSDAYLLKAPLAAGAHWLGEKGAQVRVNAMDKAVQVPAGQFAGCVETVEEVANGGAPLRRVTTLFCPDVGIVSLRAEAWEQDKHVAERAVLRSFGEPVSIVK
jgi:hypothetical protein